jgi:hypothetical protein
MIPIANFDCQSPLAKRRYGRVALALAVCGQFGTFAAAMEPVYRFLTDLDSASGIPAEARDFIRAKWAHCDGCDAEEFLTQALTLVSPTFREGLAAYDDNEYERCAQVMHGLSNDTDLFLAAHAAAYEIKALVAMDRALEAGERIAAIAADGGGGLAAHSYFAPEIDFLRGYCLLADLRYDAAAAALTHFVAAHPQAAPRLRIAARQILLELANREPGRLEEVADLMTFSGRRLKNLDAGEVVQTRQQRIVELLEALIKEAEEQEKKSCNSGGGGAGKSGQSPSNPMQQSQLPGGASPESSLRAARRISPGEVWGAMPPGERERVLQALRESFPGRYRQLVEQYYEELAKKP